MVIKGMMYRKTRAADLKAAFAPDLDDRFDRQAGAAAASGGAGEPVCHR